LRGQALGEVAAVCRAKARLPGTSSGIRRFFRYLATRRTRTYKAIEGTMATRPQGRIVETPTEARQAEPGPSVLLLLMASTGLVILVLGIVWFVFFRT